VYNLETYKRIAVILGHRGSVLSLTLSEDASLLFSSAGDRFVNVWDTKTLLRVYSIYSMYDIGDVFCVSYSSTLNTVYLGAQNTSIQASQNRKHFMRLQLTLAVVRPERERPSTEAYAYPPSLVPRRPLFRLSWTWWCSNATPGKCRRPSYTC
jgi:WD40 repeat protein